MPEVSPFSPSILLYPTGLFTAARLAVRLTQHETSVHAKLKLTSAAQATAPLPVTFVFATRLRAPHVSPRCFRAPCFRALCFRAHCFRALCFRVPCSACPALPTGIVQLPLALPPTPSPSPSAAPLAHPHSLRPHLTCLPSHLLPVPPPRAPLPPPPPHFPTHRLPLHLAQQTHSNMFVIVLALVFCAQANAMDNEGQKSIRGTVRSLAQLSIPVGQDP